MMGKVWLRQESNNFSSQSAHGSMHLRCCAGGCVLDAQTFKRMKLEPEDAYNQILRASKRVSQQFLTVWTHCLFGVVRLPS
jgi:hypothetical protein